ncbi:hypothetical protein [Diaminobutyricibacter sp. McL0608]|uniref:hypothetical protein n=1 Tax=Leifsonia sp. McL0608 TaxID=3143537 RepID=UPI0031F331CB
MTDFPPPEPNVPSGPPTEPASNGGLPTPPPPPAPPAAPVEEPPAYGERIPGYVPQPPAQQQPPVYGQQPPVYQQPPAYQQPPVYGQPAPGYAQPLYGEQVAAPKSKTLGLVAMIVGIAVFVVSLVVFIALGAAMGPFATRTSNSFTIDQTTASAAELRAISSIGLGLLAILFFGTAFGLWSLIQGIVATAKNRGRTYGIVAIVVSVLAPIISFVAFSVAIAATLPGA